MQIIAEVKTHSPFGWQASKSWDELFEIAEDIGDIISIHTNPRWQGSFELLAKARKLTSKPILAKGLHESDDEVKRALDIGADYVLVVGRLAKIHPEKCLIEPLTLAELSKLPKDVKAVWNSRDLATGGLKKDSFDDARKVFAGWLCQASNIRTIADVDKSADAVLVGTHLPEFAASLSSDLN